MAELPTATTDILPVALADQLSEAELVALADAFGGTRIYVPARMTERHRIAKAIGLAAAERLSTHAGAICIRVPLVRAVRARYYRGKGHSIAAIARRLGLTENGVNRMLQRMDRNGGG